MHILCRRTGFLAIPSIATENTGIFRSDVSLHSVCFQGLQGWQTGRVGFLWGILGRRCPENEQYSVFKNTLLKNCLFIERQRERKRKKLLSTCLFFKGAQWLKPSDARTLELHLGLSPGHLPLSSQVCQQELDQKQSGWNVNLYSNVECWCHRQCFTVPQC